MAYSNTHSNMTSKVVVGFGLAALCAVGASIFAIQAKRHVANDAAMSAATQPLSEPPAPATTNATTAGDTSSPPPITDSALPGMTPSTMTPNVNPTPTPAAPTAAPAATPASPAVDEPVPTIKAKKKSTRTIDQDAKPPIMDRTAPDTAVATEPSATTAPSTIARSDAAPSDSQISDSVKSEIASAAPTSKVIVTTTNGAVSLMGSVPSQEAIVQASQAAQRIAGVKSVDATGLFVNSQ